MSLPAFRFLTNREGFNFEIEERMGVKSPHPDYPKSFFLTNYKHPSAELEDNLDTNIEAAMKGLPETLNSLIENDDEDFAGSDD